MRKKVSFVVCIAIVGSVMLSGCSSANNEGDVQQSSSAETTQNETAYSVEQATPEYSYQDGTYTGTGRGMGGDITVILTVEGGKVTIDEIDAPYETPGVGGKEAIEDGTFKAQIEAAQSSDIDGIAGATMTTGGVKKAVDAALSQAKE